MVGPSERVKHLASYLVGLDQAMGPAADAGLKERTIQQAISHVSQWYLRHLEALNEITLSHLQSLSLDLDYLETILRQNYGELTLLVELRQTVDLILTPGAEQEFFTSRRATKFNAIQIEQLVPLLRKLKGDPQRMQALQDLADLLSAE